MNKNLHIDITKKQPVEGTSAPKVTSVTWSPEASAARSADIAMARQQAFEEHQSYLKSLSPEEKRLLAIEARLEALEKHVSKE